MRTDRGDGNDGACEFKAKIERIAEQYRSREHHLDLANASPAELLAFCVAAGVVAWGDV